MSRQGVGGRLRKRKGSILETKPVVLAGRALPVQQCVYSDDSSRNRSWPPLIPI